MSLELYKYITELCSMTILNNIRPLLYGARIFGFTPHQITDHHMIITKVGLVYSVFIASLMFCACGNGAYMIIFEIEEFKMQILVGSRTFISYISVFIDDIFTMIWNKRLCNTITLFKTYDLITKSSKKKNYKLINFCRAIIIIVIIYWSLVGFLTYMCEEDSAVFVGLIYGTMNAAISMQILKFMGFIILLYQRLTHLNCLIQQRGETISIILGEEYLMRRQNICWLHHKLMKAAEEINSIYSFQLLLWITLMFMNSLSRIHTLTIIGSGNLYEIIRDTLSAISCIVNLFIITIMCHLTAAKANSIGISIFLPQSLAHRTKTLVEDNIEVAMYFYLKKLRFTAGAGLIPVHLPLLLSIAGAITTYLVILQAFNS